MVGRGGGVLLGKAGDIFADDIEFQIDQAAGIDPMDIRMIEGIGDDGDIEFRSFHIENGEADAVEADGAFFDDQTAEFFWEFEAEFPAAFEIVAVDAGCGGIDMALDDVTVEPAVHAEASFEVDDVAGLPVAEGAFFEGFLDGGDAVTFVADFFHRQADAVMGETLVDGKFG